MGALSPDDRRRFPPKEQPGQERASVFYLVLSSLRPPALVHLLCLVCPGGPDNTEWVRVGAPFLWKIAVPSFSVISYVLIPAAAFVYGTNNGHVEAVRRELVSEKYPVIVLGHSGHPYSHGAI